MLLLVPEHAGQVAVAVHAQLEVNVAFQQIPASPLGGPLAVKRGVTSGITRAVARLRVPISPGIINLTLPAR